MTQKDQMGIGVYGGSFDPIHFAHLHLACSLYERFKLQKIYFIPAKRSPHKTRPCQASNDQRYKMLELATKNYPNFEVLDLEMKRPSPSYSIDTIKALEQGQSAPLFLLMGLDSLKNFEQWKDVKEIVRRCKPLIANRQVENLETMSPFLQKIFQEGFCQTPLLDISSTMIRKRLKNSLPCQHLCPEKVLDYIFRHELYLED